MTVMNLTLTMVSRRNVEDCKQTLMCCFGGSVEVQGADKRDHSEMTHRIKGILSLRGSHGMVTSHHQ